LSRASRGELFPIREGLGRLALYLWEGLRKETRKERGFEKGLGQFEGRIERRSRVQQELKVSEGKRRSGGFKKGKRKKR